MTSSWKAPEEVLLHEALRTASRADVVIACVGLTAWLEGEEMPPHVPGFDGGDRTTLTLPESQVRLVSTLEATGKPVILLLQSGSAISLGPLAQHAAAVLEAWYGGEFGGLAIAKVLNGDVDPAGRLPITFYRSVNDLPPFTDYSMKGRTYRYFRSVPEFPFGYGLSYSRFGYSGAEVSSDHVDAGDSVTVTVHVKNAGRMQREEVVQLYLLTEGDPSAPLRSLRGFRRIHLEPGAEHAVCFGLSPRDLAFAQGDGTMRILPGSYRIWLGGGQPDTGAEGAWTAALITGEKTLPR